MYYARFTISTDGVMVRWQRLREHLLLVSRLAARFACLAVPHYREVVGAAACGFRGMLLK